MQAQRYTDPAAFQVAALPFLIQHEAANNLLISIIGQVQSGIYDTSGTYTVTLNQGETVVGVALRTPGRDVLLSVLAPALADDERAIAMRLLAVDVHAVYGGDVPGVLGPRAAARDFANAWATQTGQQAELGMSERIYQLTELNAPDTAGVLRPATEADRPLLRAWLTAFQIEALDNIPAEGEVQTYINRALDDAFGRQLFLWEVGAQPVALASYGGETPNGMRVGPVYTPPGQRRQGYGAAATAGVTQRVLDMGKTFCFLYTDLANPTSNKIYRQLGYQPVIDVDMLRFDQRTP